MNLFERIKASITGARTRVVATFVESWKQGRPEYSETNFVNMVKSGWRKNELVFACISKTANTAAQVNLAAYNRSNDEEIKRHPLLDLIAKPNPYMSEFDFWVSVIAYQKLAGRAVYEKQRDRAGNVIALWPLRPDWLQVVPAAPYIGQYVYAPPGAVPIPLEPTDVIDFPLFDPLTPHNPHPPLEVLARSGDVDNSVTDYIKLFLDRGGVPPFVIKSVQKLQDAQVADIRRRWRERYGGFEKWTEPVVLDSDASYQKVGFDFREMGLEIIDSRNESRICQVLDVPPIIVGAKVGLDRSTYTNYPEARLSWWQDTLLALYASFEDVIQNGLVPDFDTEIYVKFDFSEVAALQEERNSRWTRATAALVAGGITINEFCEEAGLKTKGPAGNVYLRGMSTIEVPAKTGVRTTFAQPVVTVDETVDETTDEVSDEEGKSLSRNGSAEFEEKGREEERTRLEREARRKLEVYFKGQLNRIEKELHK